MLLAEPRFLASRGAVISSFGSHYICFRTIVLTSNIFPNGDTGIKGR